MELLLTAITQNMLSGLCPRNPTRTLAPVSASARTRRPVIDLADGWHLEYDESPDELSWQQWCHLGGHKQSAFLSPAYLQLLEKYPPQGIKTGLLFFFHHGWPKAGMVVQQFRFSAARQLKLATPDQQQNVWRRSWSGLGKQLASCISCGVLVGGQLLATGPHGFNAPAPLSPTQTAMALEALAAHLGQKGIRIEALLAKEPSGTDSDWKAAGFLPLPMQPNMTLHVQPEWKNFDGYIQAMSSKYRVRVRRARKKLDGIERRELNHSEIVALSPQLLAYYEEVISDADFNAVHVHQGYFAGLKAAFPNTFRLWGYFREGKLIGFCTALLQNQEMDAHFIGFSRAMNAHYQLYLNMLYDLVDAGIQSGVERIVFARTALEIKSSVGAEPEWAPVWMRLRRPALHLAATQLTTPLTAWLAPEANWVQRHPFREE